ncbi:f-box only protein 27 [Lynx pardinus]|uniref:F-box only protein 27 n=1 Tax=Lynx pardinus TaxID=191816 RepID=A0A485NS94_LYNPA|nr:f-box only protein 27 [Lynx pardinus]
MGSAGSPEELSDSCPDGVGWTPVPGEQWGLASRGSPLDGGPHWPGGAPLAGFHNSAALLIWGASHSLTRTEDKLRALSDHLTLERSPGSTPQSSGPCGPSPRPQGRPQAQGSPPQRPAAEGLRKWMVQHGGDGWVVEVNRSTVPGAPSQTCFVSSFSWCRKKQVLDLEEEGLWPELLDSGKIEICVSDWWGARHDSGCMYRLLVQLLDANQTVLDKFSAMPVPIQQWNNNVCFQVTHVFSDIKIGVRFVSFEHWGQDTQFWAGHYGARVTNSSVVVRARLS